MGVSIIKTIRKYGDWDVTHSEPYKRLHLRFSATLTLLLGSLLWIIFFWINPEYARSVWWLFVILMPLCTFLLHRMKAREILPTKQ